MNVRAPKWAAGQRSALGFAGPVARWIARALAVELAGR